MGKHHSEAEKEASFKKVCDLYGSQNVTIESCCLAAGIAEGTFRLWMSQNERFAEMYKTARERQDVVFWEQLRPKVKGALQRLVEGEEFEEITEEEGSGPMGPTSKTRTRKVLVQPNSSAVIFALKGLYPGVFADYVKQETTHRVEEGTILKVEFRKPDSET